MSYEIIPDYSQTFVFPPALEDWVPPDHPARFIRLFVESLDLKALGFKSRKSLDGRPNYSNDLLLKIWVYGYFEKIRSNRKLEKACKNQLPLVWLTGLNFPDHNSIWRFFSKNETALKQIFKQSVKLAHKCDMVGMVLQAIDGTKIMANASKSHSISKADLTKLLEKIDESVDEVIEQIKQTEKQESERDDPGYQLPPQLQDKSRLKKLIKDGLDELSVEEKLELKKGVESGLKMLSSADSNHINLTDENSGLMKHNNGAKEFSYNAQAAVDSQEQIITGAKTCSEANDRHQLCEMIEESASNTGKVSDESVADNGYFCGEELSAADDKGYEVLVDLSKDIKGVGVGKYHKSHFSYDCEKDAYICPEGEELPFCRERKASGKDYNVRVYCCKNKACRYRSACTKSKRGREIERTPFEESVKKQLRKQSDAANKKLLQLRKEIVEPVFGWIKWNQGFYHWSFRDPNKVDTQWKLICATVNLQKIYRKWLCGEVCFSGEVGSDKQIIENRESGYGDMWLWQRRNV